MGGIKMEKIEILSEKEQRKVLVRLLSYTKPHSKTIAVAFVLLVLTTIGDIVLPILVKIFIDDYLTPRKLIFQQLFVLGSVYMGIQVVKAVLLFFQLVLFQTIALKIIQQLRIDVFSKVQALGLKYFDKTPAGSIVSRVTNDTEAIKDMFVTVISTFIQSGFLLVGIFIAMFILNVKLALLCVIIIPLILFVMRLYRKLSSRFYLDMRERLSQLNEKLSESLQGMAIVQMFRQEKRLRQEFGEINDQHFNAGMKNIKIDGLLLRPTFTNEQIEEAAQFVQAHVFIEKLEDGYDDKVVERGATFSSGQRQLIAFARTIAANPKILILDEATANIDTETEETIQTALAKMRRGRTTIAIAHRLSTIQDADCILVLHQGEIVERGTHQELLAQGGLYYKMFLLQIGTFERLEDVVNK